MSAKFDRMLTEDPSTWIQNVSRSEVVSFLAYAQGLHAVGQDGDIPDDAFEKYALLDKRVWRAWARRDRHVRALRLFLHLLHLADHLQITHYTNLSDVTGCENHQENTLILKVITDVCQLYSWPPYPALVVTRDGESGDGMLDDYGVFGELQSRRAVESAFRKLCWGSRRPSLTDILTAWQDLESPPVGRDNEAGPDATNESGN